MRYSFYISSRYSNFYVFNSNVFIAKILIFVKMVSSMKAFYKELKHRNVVKGSLAYLVIAWILLQVASIVLPIIESPEWVLKAFTFFLVLVFPIWVIISWVYEITPEGLTRTSKVNREDSISDQTNKRLNIVILIGLVMAVLFSFVNKPNSKELVVKSEVSNSIAVLPFDDMSPDGDSQWFCDGVIEDILTNLSKVGKLRVISRTSVMGYKNSDKTVPQIAKELGVSYILEGSVRKHNNNVLITAQLISADDEHLWADSFNEKSENIFKIQNDVAKEIVAQLKIELSPEEENVINAEVTDNVEAYELILEGKSLFDGTEEGIDNAIKLFKKAIMLDANYADAYALIGISIIYKLNIGLMNYDEGLFEAKKYIDKSFDVKPNNLLSFHALCNYYRRSRNLEGLKETAVKAIELYPNDGDINWQLARYLNTKPIFDQVEYLEQISKVQKIDPFTSSSNFDKIYALLLNKKIDEAEEHYAKMKFAIDSTSYSILECYIEVYKKKDWTEFVNYRRKSLNENPDSPWYHRSYAYSCAGILGDNVKALIHFKKAYELSPPNYYYSQPYFYSLLYNRKFEVARELLNDKKFMSVFNGDRHSYIFFDYHYYKGEYKEALTYLERHKVHSQYYLNKAAVYAYLNKLDIVYDILNNHLPRNEQKALVFAIMKERDSMYNCMNRITKPIRIRNFNQYPELDIYRNEPRFKEFLKKNYLPLQNNNVNDLDDSSISSK